MNQMVEMFIKSNARMERLMKAIDGTKKPDMEVIAAAQREYEAQSKQLNILVNIFAVASKNRRAIASLEKMNILDDSTAVKLLSGNQDDDNIKCPMKDNLITRSECLDYSGTHYEECKGCEIGKATKSMLLPNDGE